MLVSWVYSDIVLPKTAQQFSINRRHFSTKIDTSGSPRVSADYHFINTCAIVPHLLV